MSWVIAALLATALMTIINFGDKLVSSRYVQDPNAILVFFGFLNLFIGILLWAFSGFVLLPAQYALPLVFSGAISVGGGYFYFQAVMKEEMSRLIVLSQLVPIYTLIMSVIFLGQRPTALQLLGFAFILVAAIGVSLDRRETKEDALLPARGSILRLMLTATFLWSLAFILQDATVDAWVEDIPTLMQSIAYNNLGAWITAILLLTLPHVRRAVLYYLRQINLESVFAMGGVQGLFMVRNLLLFQAFLLGQAGLVAVVSSMNVFIGVFLGWGLTLLWPGIYKEDISRNNLLRKFAWALVAFVGILLVR